MEREIVHGSYGSFAIRCEPHSPVWSCYESCDYHYFAVTDDFGNLVPVSAIENIRGY